MNNVDSFTCYSFFMDSEKISIISVADPVSALADPVIYLLKATINNAYVVLFSTQKQQIKQNRLLGMMET